MAGAIIGYDACLAGKDRNGNQFPLMSVGRVKIGNDVRIGSYSVVSRGLFPFEATTVGDFSILGYGVDLSHNVCIGKNVIILDQSQVCGNAIVKDNVHISPQVVVSNRLKLEERVTVSIGSVVVNDVKKGLTVAGNYAIEKTKFLLWHRNKLRIK
jgi:UDP-3-O-[3-hydroxymyristoyl] glucosamine N-acyltransferase